MRLAQRLTRDHCGVDTTLAVALIGVAGTIVGTISGVLITELLSHRREKAAWNREMERQRAHWAREDTARTFEYRRKAYVDFYQAAVDNGFQTYRYIMDVHIDGAPERELAGRGEVQEALELVHIYGSPRVKALAEGVQHELLQFRSEAVQPDLDVGPHINELLDNWDAAAARLLDAIREELGIPSADASNPVP